MDGGIFAFSAKSVTGRGQLHEATAEKRQSAAEAKQIISAEARSDEQASQIRAVVVLFRGCLEPENRE